MKMVKLRRYLPRFYPTLFMALITFLTWLPELLRRFKPSFNQPGSYWLIFVIPAVIQLEPLVCATFVAVPILYVIFRIVQRHQPKTAVDEDSPRVTEIVEILELGQILFIVPLFFASAIIWFGYFVFFLPFPPYGPYHLDSLKHNGFEYNVTLEPRTWGENPYYVFYKCNISGQNCVEQEVFKASEPMSSFQNFNQQAAKLGVLNNEPYLCIYDSGDIYLIKFLMTDHQYSFLQKAGDSPCGGKWPSFDPLE